MRRFVLRCSAVVLCCVPAVAVAGALQGVTFEGGGGYARLNSRGGNRPGGGGFLGASVPLRPWLSVGGELGVYGFGDAEPQVTDGSIYTYDHTMLGTLMATFRVMPPIRSGPRPFLVSQAGVARLRLGAMYEHFYSAHPYAWGAEDDLVFCSAIGIGLRGAWPRPAPGFELSVRSVMLGGDTPRTVLAPRLSLTY